VVVVGDVGMWDEGCQLVVCYCRNPKKKEQREEKREEKGRDEKKKVRKVRKMEKVATYFFIALA
jgi:hypothetical protein